MPADRRLIKKINLLIDEVETQLNLYLLAIDVACEIINKILFFCHEAYQRFWRNFGGCISIVKRRRNIDTASKAIPIPWKSASIPIDTERMAVMNVL